MTEETPTSCPWCEKPFRARQTGGWVQRFCQPFCRRAFHAAVRSWALDAIAGGTLTLAEIRNDGPATRALCRSGERLSPLPEDAGSCDNALPYLMARFIVEVPRSTIEGFVRLGWLRGDQRDDLAAVTAALRRLGQAPAVARTLSLPSRGAYQRRPRRL
jgi:hypothetical protein